jgi:hypothetical protein
MSDVLDWHHAVADIPDEGIEVTREATADERQRIAEGLDLLACTSLIVRYSIKPRGSGHYRLAGTLTARVEQSCVVTLEPLTNDVSERFSVDFWPENALPAQTGGLIDVHDEPDMEPIADDQIDAGRIIFECFANGIDLFPRKPGAAFEAPEPAPEKSEGPFAALARMRQKR